MSVDITSLAPAFRSTLESQGVSIRLGHTHQLLAAALGYKSLAAYQTAQEKHVFNRSMYWLVDGPQVIERAASLGLTLNVDVFSECLAVTSGSLSGPYVCSTLNELSVELRERLEDAAEHDHNVINMFAETNCAGPFTASMIETTNFLDRLPSHGDAIEIEYEGTVGGAQDLDRPYSGDKVIVNGKATLAMLGRRIFGPPKIEIVTANLDGSWFSTSDTDDEPPIISMAEALSIELDIPLNLAEQLVDAEITQAETNSGVPNGFLVDLTNCLPSDVVHGLYELHGNMQIWVQGLSFERVSPYD